MPAYHGNGAADLAFRVIPVALILWTSGGKSGDSGGAERG
jgi:hypothetical protein